MSAPKKGGMKSGSSKSDWFWGAMSVVAVLAFSRVGDLIPSLERKAYDLIGRWPCSREVHARMTDLLVGAKAEVIVNTVFFSKALIQTGEEFGGVLHAALAGTRETQVGIQL